MKLRDDFGQRRGEAGPRRRTPRLAGQRGHHAAHLLGGDATQKRLANQQRDILGAALKLGHHLRQKTPFAGARHAQPQRAELGHEIPGVISVAVVLALRRAHVAPAHHVEVALPFAQSIEKLLRRLLRPRLQVAPKTFLQILHKMLEMLADWDYLRHGCRSPFFGMALACEAKANLHPLPFYTTEFTSQPRNGSYATQISKTGVIQ